MFSCSLFENLLLAWSYFPFFSFFFSEISLIFAFFTIYLQEKDRGRATPQESLSD